MKSIAIFLLFTGVILVIHGIYEQKFQSLKKTNKIEYRFIPRTYYEEQLSKNASASADFKNMFDRNEPWFERTVTLSKEPK